MDKTGKFVIRPTFWSAESFSEGLAAVWASGEFVRIDGNKPAKIFGYIDRSGQIAIPHQFHEVQPFSEGLAAVRVGEHWGYIDTEGNYVVHPGWKLGWPGPIVEAEDFSGGLARIHIGGERRSSSHHRDRWIGGTWYYINRQGEIVRHYRTERE